MQTKSENGSAEWTDPDDAPPLTAAMLDDAEFFHGDTFIRRGRGRPPTGNAKELVSLRLDQDVLAKLRAAGPGWQTRVNSLLRQALHLPAAGTAAKDQAPEEAAGQDCPAALPSPADAAFMQTRSGS